jgi:predicted ATP-dependent endonuclease of OLD family
MLPATDKARLINIHCLFNPAYVPDLENDFFSRIENQAGKKMNRYGITSYGKSLDSSLTEDRLQYAKGIDNFAIDIRALNEVANNKDFRDNALLVVSNSNNDGASAVQRHYDLFENENGSLDGVRKSIYYMSDAIFSGNPKDVKYFLGKKSEGLEGYNSDLHKQEVDEVVKNRGSLKSCLVGCDAHKESDLFKKFTWVKADTNFEGLRQICFEPESRVKIQQGKPDFKEGKLVIDKVRFVSPGNVFSSNYINFNPNLNVIIGGKSSGKSILLYAIAKTLSADSEVLKNDDESYKYDFNKIEKGVDFEVTTKGGFNQRLNRGSDVNSILPEIKYIPQNYLVKLAEPEVNKKGKTLNKLVRDLIIEDIDSREIYQGFLDKVIQNDKVRNGQIDLYFEIKNEIELLEAELKTKSNKEVLNKNIEANIAKVEELSIGSGLSPQQMAQYKEIQSGLEQNSLSLQNFKSDFSSTRSFNADFVKVLSSLKQKKDLLLSGLLSDEVREYYTNEYSAIDNLFGLSAKIEKELQFESDAGGQRNLKEGSKFKSVYDKIDAERQKLGESIQPYLKNDLIRKSIDELNQSIANDKKSLLDIGTITKKVQDKKKLLDSTKVEIFRIYEVSYHEYTSVVENLKSRTIDLDKDGLEIIGKAQFNFPKLRREIIDASDRRSASYNKYDVLSEDKKATDDVDFASILDGVKKLFEAVLSKKYVLSSRTTMSSAIKIILDDYFFDYWKINYKNDQLGEMSTGKASFVILMLIIGLSKSKAPILIDQPEDNLDNRSITTDLVNYLRNKKLDRQIIIVTHNANVVVNADAENVIVANQKGQNNEFSSSVFKFDYINGAIENSFEKVVGETDVLKSMGIRQHVADIVEGGKEAFIMREKKYRFS